MNQPHNEPTGVERSAQPSNNPVVSASGERTQLSAQDLAPRDLPEPELLGAYGDDETITDRVRTALDHELHADHLSHLNINMQQGGSMYLRGPVHLQEKSTHIAQMVHQLGAVREE